MLGVDTRWWFSALVVLVAVQRLAELRLARRNVGRLLARGGVGGGGHYPWMVALHAAFLVSCLAEVGFLGRPFLPVLAALSLGVLALASGLRYWAVRTLGERWTTRIVVLPGAAPIATGPYRFLRHPNYLAVVLEIAALPLVHTAWATAVVFSALDGVLLAHRIRTEERALEGASKGRAEAVLGAAGGEGR